MYVLVNNFGLDMWHYYQPKEFIHASLMENALSQLNIKRSYGTMGIYSLAEKTARERTIRILGAEGNKDIKITSSFLTTFDGGIVGYNVSDAIIKCKL